MSAKGVSNGSPACSAKRVVRHRESNCYFKDGLWVQDPELADSYPDVVEAARACVHYDLSNVEMELRYPSGQNFFSLPLR